MSRHNDSAYFTQAVAANLTQSVPHNISSDYIIGIYSKVELWSAFVLVVLSPITVLTNGLFLFALYQDSLRCFRKTPTTAFIAGLSLADFITGLLVEPAFASYYFLHYYQPNSSAFQKAKVVYVIGGSISTIAISVSFVTVLAMSLSQYIAIRYPYKYKTIVNTKRVVRLQVLSGVYFLAFSLLQYTGISRRDFLLLDVVLHPTVISCLLIIVHILLRREFTRRVTKPARGRTEILKQISRIEEIKSSPAISKTRDAHSLLTIVSDSPLSNRESERQNKDTNYSSSSNSSMSKNCDNQQEYAVNTGRNKNQLSIYTGNGEQETESLGNELISMTTKRRDSETIECIPMVERTKPTSFVGRQGNEEALFSGKRKKLPIEKQIAVMSFYLSAILLLSSLSHTIVFYVFLLRKPQNYEENVYVHIALRITDLMLFVKVCLDAFIFAWRLPAFRTFLMLTISCGRIQLRYQV